jgi:ATP-dependent RNA helicase DDX49/DBP8
MLKAGDSSSKRRKLNGGSKTSKSAGKAEVGKAAAQTTAASEDAGMTLDPMEVMKAMMAAQSSKRPIGSDRSSERDEESDGEQDSGDEDGSADEADDDSDAELDSPRTGDKLSAPSRGDGDSDSEDEPLPAPPLESGPSRSRIALASRFAPTNSTPIAPTPSDPFSSHPKPSSATSFESLGLSVPLINALSTINITKPTEIQSACVEAIMAGRDCIGGAKTGSGKTLAFALPIVERIARDPYGVWAVVLTPTR